MQSRPHIFSSEEVPSAVQELFGMPGLLKGMHAYLPEPICNNILLQKDSIQTVYDFQKNLISPIVSHIEDKSVEALNVSGMQNLDPMKRYLFISNHRDIVLDSAFINNSLFKKGYSTCQIAIGDNLMKHRMSELIFKLNKSFEVKRSGTPMELYHYSVSLSEYIHTLISENVDSVWIAQREGRAKDGNDCTQVGLLKMLSLANTGDLKEFFKNLNIVPVSISYEFNPCDHLLAQEFLNRSTDPNYKKSFEEDMSHILLGLWGTKGRVHIHFGKLLEEELEIFDTETNNKKQLALLCQLLDQSIQDNYLLRPINYVAQSLLNREADNMMWCSEAEKKEAEQYFEQKRKLLLHDINRAGFAYILKMYANPAVNYLNNKVLSQ